MKKVLIIGTSHTESTCLYKKGEPIIRLEGRRWQDYLEDHDYEVTTIARAGCTVDQQFAAVFSYFHENPDVKFDLAIIEGRALETNIAMPGEPYTNTKINYSSYWKRWDTSQSIKEYEQETIMPIDSYKIEDKPEHQGYYTDYLFSMHHAWQHWTTTYALCKLVETRAPIVKWWNYSIAADFVSNPDAVQVKLGYDIIKEWFIDDINWPIGMTVELYDDELCLCKHANVKGHKRIWDEYIYPRIKNYL